MLSYQPYYSIPVICVEIIGICATVDFSASRSARDSMRSAIRSTRVMKLRHQLSTNNTRVSNNAQALHDGVDEAIVPPSIGAAQETKVVFNGNHTKALVSPTHTSPTEFRPVLELSPQLLLMHAGVLRFLGIVLPRQTATSLSTVWAQRTLRIFVTHFVACLASMHPVFRTHVHEGGAYWLPP